MSALRISRAKMIWMIISVLWFTCWVLGYFRICSMCQKPVVLRYWNGTWRCGASRQAIES